MSSVPDAPRIGPCTPNIGLLPPAPQDLVQRLLDVTPRLRYIATDALTHPWLMAASE